ncbi:BTAD domain-containing putative transcriptional regulator [Rathayibacter sp. YIM 133350]|uniref:ATP-binding protein n=1 Tax=Rathayibacter sp. YIM 133350 TaxID=3131992 RepID=UPI00307F10CC
MQNAAPSSPRVALLGPVLVAARDGGMTEPPGSLAKALVAILAGDGRRAPRRPVSTSAIIEELWGESPPRNAKAALQTLVSRLRTVTVDGLVVSTAAGYGLDLDDVQTDLGAALSLAQRAEHALTLDAAQAHALADAGLAHWRGEPGADLADAPVRATLEQAAGSLRSRLAETRARALMARGRPAEALEDLDILASARPFDDGLQTLRVRALADAGRRQEALAAYAEHRQRLRDELGSSPGPELTALNTSLLREADATTSTGRTRIGVRAAPNALLGRAADIAAVTELLTHSRLVTILGAGGLGKTRLAQEIAGSSSEQTVIVVELASVRSDEDVALALASTIGIREVSTNQRMTEVAARPDVRSRILTQLAERPTLLVLDNCEQIIEGAARWAADLLAAAPRLRILATSRSPLAISSEAVYALEPLAAVTEDGSPAPGPAVQLFLDRARAVRPGAALPLPSIMRLCTRLDGLPLAIELAAARVRSMSVEEIENRLENRFSLLTSGDRSAPERHRTLEAVIDWSWRLLHPRERSALARLALFTDGFSADAASLLTGADPVEDLLDALASQSLLSVIDDASGQARYRMLETVREFGQTRLADDGDFEPARDALFAWAEDFALQALPRFSHLEVFEGVRREQDNLLSVLRQAIQLRRADVVFSVYGLLTLYWSIRGAHSEVVGFTESVLDATRRYDPDEAHVAPTASSYLMMAGTNLATRRPIGQRAVVRLRNLRARHVMSNPTVDGASRFLLAMPDESAAFAALEDMRHSPDAVTELIAMVISSQLAENDGRIDEASAWAQRAWDLAQGVDDIWLSSMSASMMAELASQSADHSAALRWVERAEQGLRLIGADDDLLQLHWTRAVNLVGTGQLDQAADIFRSMVTEQFRMADGWELRSLGHVGLAEIARLETRTEDSLTEYRQAMAVFHESRQKFTPWYVMTLASFIAAGTDELALDAAEVAALAHLLRMRIIAMRRARADFIDKPVLGTAVVGWSAWALGVPALRDLGLRLLCLGEVLHARQDLPSMQLDRHRAAAERILGRDAVDRERERAATLTPEAAAELADDLIRQPLPADS